MTASDTAHASTTPVRHGYEIDAGRLAGWMDEHVPGFAGPATIVQFAGGQSNPTYRVDARGRSWVLRRKPPGPILKGAHAVEREARVLQALGGAGFPVPHVHGLCTDPNVIGTEFMVMDMVEGRIFWDATLPEIPREERAAYYDAMNGTIARLHSIDPDAVGLGDYGPRGAYFERQVRRWSRQYAEDVDGGRDPNMDGLVAWLPDHIPADGDETRIVHGDFRIDNLIFDPVEPRVIAVLDWELSTLGHPLSDFAYHAMTYLTPPHIVAGLAGTDPAELGLPSMADYVAAYCRRTGRADVPDLGFYLAFNFFRLAAIFHGISGRAARGNAVSAAARAKAAAFPELAASAWAQVERMEE